MEIRITSAEEIQELLERCFRLLNKYMSMYKATSWSRQVVGHDDYLSLLRFVRRGIEAHEAEIEKQMESWGKGQ